MTEQQARDFCIANYVDTDSIMHAQGESPMRLWEWVAVFNQRADTSDQAQPSARTDTPST